MFVKMVIIFVLILFTGQISFGAPIMICNCTFLLKNTSNTNYYQLANDIDCSGLDGSSVTFSATLDGAGFSILNFAHSGNSSCIALFAHGIMATVMNLNLRNFVVTSTSTGPTAGLFGYCHICNLTNVNIYNSSITGKIF